jgi:hypothetical protein
MLSWSVARQAHVCPFERGSRKCSDECRKDLKLIGIRRQSRHCNVSSCTQSQEPFLDSSRHFSISWFFWKRKRSCYMSLPGIGLLPLSMTLPFSGVQGRHWNFLHSHFWEVVTNYLPFWRKLMDRMLQMMAASLEDFKTYNILWIMCAFIGTDSDLSPK